MNLSDLINESLNLAERGDEFILYFHPGEQPEMERWSCGLGNTCDAVHMWESTAAYAAEGSTAEVAVENLIHVIRETKQRHP